MIAVAFSMQRFEVVMCGNCGVVGYEGKSRGGGLVDGYRNIREDDST